MPYRIKKQPLTAVDLFCGAGGFSKGLEDVGLRVLAAYDNWDQAVLTYNRNMSHSAVLADLSDMGIARSIKDMSPDIIVGGPPCQDFSAAGKREEATNALLTPVFSIICGFVRPSLILMENVPYAIKSRAYGVAKGFIMSMGYKISESVINAAYCGVPQNRKRFFMLAYKSDIVGDKWRQYITAAQSRKPMTVRQYLGDELDFEHYYIHPRLYQNKGIYSVDEPSPVIVGDLRRKSSTYVRHPRDTADPSDVRDLTLHERARYQTFPSTWVWEGTNRQISNMIGNAVPVNMARFLGRGILYATGRQPWRLKIQTLFSG